MSGVGGSLGDGPSPTKHTALSTPILVGVIVAIAVFVAYPAWTNSGDDDSVESASSAEITSEHTGAESDPPAQTADGTVADDQVTDDQPTNNQLDTNHNDTWIEEFDTFDSSSWLVEFSTFGDPESQHCYRPENVEVEDGTLLITARAGETNCPHGETRPYSSGMIRSVGLVDRTYGEFEIVASFPVGAGLWPALWLSPTERRFGPWPRSGEIDIAESIGQEPAVTACSLHYWDEGTGGPGRSHSHHTERSFEAIAGAGSTATTGFRAYGLRWTPTELTWTVDGEPCHTVDLQEAGLADVFGEPFHFRVNLAVGGGWPGPPDPTAFPAVMAIERITYEPLTASESRG